MVKTWLTIRALLCARCSAAVLFSLRSTRIRTNQSDEDCFASRWLNVLWKCFVYPQNVNLPISFWLYSTKKLQSVYILNTKLIRVFINISLTLGLLPQVNLKPPQTHQTTTAGCFGFKWTQYCTGQAGILYMGLGDPIPAKSNSQLGGSVTAWCCIAMDSVLCRPGRDTLHGARVSQFQLSPTVGW